MSEPETVKVPDYPPLVRLPCCGEIDEPNPFMHLCPGKRST